MAKKKIRNKVVNVYLTELEHDKLIEFCDKNERTMNGVFRLGMLKVMKDEK